MLNGIKILIVCCFTLSLVSCDLAASSYTPQSVDLSKSRFVVYSYSDSKNIPEYSFYINGISLKNSSGQWIELSLKPYELNTEKLRSGQVLLGEFFVDPNVYNGLRLNIANVRDSGGNPVEIHGGGILDFKYNIGSTPSSTHLINLNWNFTRDSFAGGVFKPEVNLRSEELSASELLLFVSNSGSNYVTVIDGYKGIAIGAVTVGLGPKGIALNTEGSRLYVLNSKDSTVSVVDPNNLMVLQTIDVGSGFNPTDMVFASQREGSMEGKLYITNNGSRDVTVLSVEPDALLGNVEVGLGPGDIEIDRIRKEVYVVNEDSNELSVISTLTDKEVSRIPVCDGPVSVSSGDSQILHVFCPEVGHIDKVDLKDMIVVEKLILDASMSKGLHVDDFSGFYATDISSGEVLILDSFGTVISEVYIGESPYDMAYDNVLSNLYVANDGGYVTVLSLVTIAVENIITVGSKPYGIVSYRQRGR